MSASSTSAAPKSSSGPSTSSEEVVDTAYSSPGAPSVTNDPRFRAGRKLVVNGRADKGAVGFFATLVEESRRKYGDSSIEAAPCYYEYGNALFRADVKQRGQLEDDETDTEEDAKPAAKVVKKIDIDSPSSTSAVRSAAAEAAERRMAAASKEKKDNSKEDGERSSGEKSDMKGSVEEKKASNSTVKENQKEVSQAAAKSSSKESDDTILALELMENAWSIFDQYVSQDDSTNEQRPHKGWANSQLPRTLTGIGDVLSDLGRHADAADAYTRALAHRERAVEDLVKSASGEIGLGLLAARRHLVEANILVAEELLACPADKDVTTTETGDVLVKASERVEYARGYYDKARDGLQEAVFLMGRLAAAGTDLGNEKEDVCYLATMVMGVGTALAEFDEEVNNKPTKKLKTG